MEVCVMLYKVYRVSLDDTNTLIWFTDDYEEALVVRDISYRHDEEARKNGEFVENYRYIIVKDI